MRPNVRCNLARDRDVRWTSLSQLCGVPRGDKSAAPQKRQDEHIEQGYEHRGIPEKEAE
jgi:hypothetical protein